MAQVLSLAWELPPAVGTEKQPQHQVTCCQLGSGWFLPAESGAVCMDAGGSSPRGCVGLCGCVLTSQAFLLKGARVASRLLLSDILSQLTPCVSAVSSLPQCALDRFPRHETSGQRVTVAWVFHSEK